MHLVLICITAKAAYPGSAICRMPNMSLSTSSIFEDSSYDSGIVRYGGRGCPVVILEESMASRDVISWEVMFTELKIL